MSGIYPFDYYRPDSYGYVFGYGAGYGTIYDGWSRSCFPPYYSAGSPCIQSCPTPLLQGPVPHYVAPNYGRWY